MKRIVLVAGMVVLAVATALAARPAKAPLVPAPVSKVQMPAFSLESVAPAEAPLLFQEPLVMNSLDLTAMQRMMVDHYRTLWQRGERDSRMNRVFEEAILNLLTRDQRIKYEEIRRRLTPDCC